MTREVNTVSRPISAFPKNRAKAKPVPLVSPGFPLVVIVGPVSGIRRPGSKQAHRMLFAGHNIILVHVMGSSERVFLCS